ncbi:MAG: aminotransferase class V-fold PLP-dependent enzyme [Ignavibacteriales bacterium]|nr:MAG: aminotransferase class V-fold PLP-dependent enzyme [Ignavibacteriales bacterium]
MFGRTPGTTKLSSAIGRKDFLVRTGLLLGAAAFTSAGFRHNSIDDFSPSFNPDSWKEIKDLFPLDKNMIQMAHFFLTSHPEPVRKAIEKIRDGLDKNPIGYIFEHEIEHEANVLGAAAEYLGVNPHNIALTDSTTMGLGTFYTSMDLKADQEILTTTHDHYSTETSLNLKTERSGAMIKRISLYEYGVPTTANEIVDRLKKNISSKTKYVVVTWVHSSSGMKLPIAKMSEAIKEINRNRDEKDKIIFCVDGVHGFGIENTTIPELGCDVFIAGTHKWIFGPRGTGLVWASDEAWKLAHATIPTFDLDNYEIWMNAKPPKEIAKSVLMTPGGFKSFEHRWAVDAAFEFHKSIGKQKIQDRIHLLNTMLKQRLCENKKIKMITPMSEELSSGITCFEVEGKIQFDFVGQLWDNKIAASVTPYKTWFVRLAPSLVTLEEDVEKAVKVVESLV